MQNLLRVLLVLVFFECFAMMSRAFQYGLSPFLLVKILASSMVCGALIFQKNLPSLVMAGICLGGAIVSMLADIYSFGIVAPVFAVLAVIPVTAAIIWGWRVGVAALAVACIGVGALVLAHKTGTIQPVVSASVYVDDYRNWVLLCIGFVFPAGWALAIGVLYRYSWDSTFNALLDEEARRIESDASRDQADDWWRSMSQNISGVMFDYVRYPDGKSEVLRMSDGSRAFWGLEPDSIEKNINVLFERVDQAARETIESKIVYSMDNMQAFSARIPTTSVSGEKKWMQVSCRPRAYESDAVLWHCLALDVSREVLAEQEAKVQAELLQQSERQKSIGQLAGGVAHDFNNFLALILGNLELLRDDKDSPDYLMRIDDSINAVMRGSDLTRNMLAYSRQAPLEPKVLDLNALVRESKNWFSRAIPANIEFDTSFLANLWKVEVDKSSTVSALLNLVLNARDSMPDGGKITIETSNVRIDNDYINERGEEITCGRYVLLAFSDTGVGIAPELLNKIFEPFYTTKEPGDGTGLGLPMILGFLKQSGGTARVYSEPDVGTTFKLYFPAVTDLDKVKPTAKKEVVPDQSKGVRILLVEDDAKILKNLQTFLTREGYSVQTALSGDEAARIFEADSAFDLVMTDIVMPGKLQGTTLSHKLREIRPDIPMVFMSGYARESAVHGNGLRSEDIRLMKPIRRSDMIMAIEESMKT